MGEKIRIQLTKVQETLLLPLWGRAVEAKKPNPQLFDKKALDIIEKLDYDFSTITQNINRLSQMGWVARSLQIDSIVSEFIKEFPHGTIVNIGCGMDTTFDRIDNGRILFYELDLPEVIELRRKFFQDNERRKTIAGSFLDNNWLADIEVKDGLMCIAGGVFYYFDDQQMKTFFTKMANRFGKCDFIFDFLSDFGIKVATKKVLKAGGMNGAAIGKSWGIKKVLELENWDSRIRIVSEIPMYKGLKKEYSFKMKLGSYFSDFFNIASIVHLRTED